MTSFFVTSYCLLFFIRWQCQCHTNTDMGGPDSESADNSSVKKHQETLRILTSCYHSTTYAYVLRWFYRIHGKSRKNLEWFPCKGDAKSATWTKSIKGDYFWKNKPRSPIFPLTPNPIYTWVFDLELYKISNKSQLLPILYM